MRLRSVQVLRGVAALAVVAHHAFPGTRIGAAGVDLFFVISGFIMATCGPGRSPGEFLASRAWRVYPLWLIAVTPWLLMSPHSLLEIVRSLTLWPVYGDRFLDPALGVGWTLSFELLFYLGFALALATRAAVPLLVFAVCVLLGFHSSSILFWFLGSPLTFEFLLGVAVARMPRKDGAAMAAVAASVISFALAPSDFFNQAFGQGAIYRVVAWGIPSAMLLYGAWSMERRFAGRGWDFAVLIGSASYSIYLFHQLVFLRVHGPTGMVVSALTGIAVYWMVERHLMRARPSWLTYRRASPEPAAQPASAALSTYPTSRSSPA